VPRKGSTRKGSVAPISRARVLDRITLDRDRAPKPARVTPEFRAEVLGELAALTGLPRFHDHHVDDLAHRLKQYEREPWTKAGIDRWWARLKGARADKAACVTVIALLQQAKGQNFEAASTAVKAIVAALDSDIEWFEDFLGRGTKPRRPWAIMARAIGDLTLEALRGADELAGRKPRRGFGSATGPLVRFVHERLAHICERTGEKLPELAALYDVLIGKS
jgi:hypothetical protein